jgi:hypothetical protein
MLLGRILSIFEKKIICMQKEMQEKLDCASHFTGEQIKTLASGLVAIREEQSRQRALAAQERDNLTLVFTEANEKHARALQAHIDEIGIELRGMDEKNLLNIEVTQKSIEDAIKTSANEFIALKDLMAQEFAVVSQNTDTKLVCLHELLQNKVDQCNSIVESSTLELAGAVQRANENTEGVKNDLESKLITLAENIKIAQDADIRALDSKFHDVHAGIQTQITEHKISADDTNAALSASINESKEMIKAAQLQGEDRLSAAVSEIHIQQSKIKTELGQEVESLCSRMDLHEREIHLVVQEHKLNLADAMAKADELVQSVQKKVTQDLADLGGVLGNEVACISREIELKLSTTKEEFKKHTESSRIALEGLKGDVSEALQRTECNVEKVTSQYLNDIQQLGVDMRSEQKRLEEAVNMNVAAVCGELQVQVDANSSMIQGIRCEIEVSIQTSREQMEAAESRSAQNLSIIATDIRGEQAVSLHALRDEVNLKADLQINEVICSIKKLSLELATSVERFDHLLHSVKSDNSIEISALQALLTKEVNEITGQTEKKILCVTDYLQLQIDSNVNSSVKHHAEVSVMIDETEKKWGNAKTDLLNEISLLQAGIKDCQNSVIHNLDEKLSRVYLQQDSAVVAVQVMNEDVKNIIQQFQLLDLSTHQKLDDITKQMEEARHECKASIQTVRESMALGTSRLEEIIQATSTGQNTLKDQLQGIRSELQLQIDASTDSIDKFAAEFDSFAVSITKLIEEIKTENSRDFSSLKQSKMDLSTEVEELKLLLAKCCNNLRTFEESNETQFSKHREELKTNAQAIDSNTEASKVSALLQIEALHSTIRTEMASNLQTLGEQIRIVRQELQTNLDASLLQNHQIEQLMMLEGSRPQINNLDLDAARAEWKSDILSLSAHMEAENTTVFHKLDAKIELSCSRFSHDVADVDARLENVKAELISLHNQVESRLFDHISHTTATIEKAVVKFSDEADMHRALIRQFESSSLQNYGSLDNHRHNMSQKMEELEKHLSQIQEQHTFCMTSTMQDRQELGEIHITVGQALSDIAKNAARHHDFLQRDEERHAKLDGFVNACDKRITSLEENIILVEAQKEIRNTASTAVSENLSSQFTLLSENYKIFQSDTYEKLMKLDGNISQSKSSSEQIMHFAQTCKGEIETANQVLMRLTAEHETSKQEVLGLESSTGKPVLQTVKSLEIHHQELSQKLEEWGKQLSEMKEQHTFCISDVVKDRQELGETQLALEQARSDISILVTGHNELLEESMKSKSQLEKEVSLLRTLIDNDFKRQLKDQFDELSSKQGSLDADYQAIKSEFLGLGSMILMIPTVSIDCLQNINLAVSALCSKVQHLQAEFFSLRFSKQQNSPTPIQKALGFPATEGTESLCGPVDEDCARHSDGQFKIGGQDPQAFLEQDVPMIHSQKSLSTGLSFPALFAMPKIEQLPTWLKTMIANEIDSLKKETFTQKENYPRKDFEVHLMDLETKIKSIEEYIENGKAVHTVLVQRPIHPDAETQSSRLLVNGESGKRMPKIFVFWNFRSAWTVYLSTKLLVF